MTNNNHPITPPDDLQEQWKQEWLSVRPSFTSFHEWMLAKSARWGNYPGSPDSSTLQPVPITEHLPEPEDCNDEGEVWAWRRFSLEKDMDEGDFWCLAYHKWLEGEDGGFTHWLPAHALPLPTHD